jgi:hypothetical protein
MLRSESKLQKRIILSPALGMDPAGAPKEVLPQ